MEEDILSRLKALEEENQRLRRAIACKSPETTTYVSMWKGRPIITFEGSFRPFSFSLKKALLVIERIQDIRTFVEQNKKYLGGNDDEPTHGTTIAPLT